MIFNKTDNEVTIADYEKAISGDYSCMIKHKFLYPFFKKHCRFLFFSMLQDFEYKIDSRLVDLKNDLINKIMSWQLRSTLLFCAYRACQHGVIDKSLIDILKNHGIKWNLKNSLQGNLNLINAQIERSNIIILEAQKELESYSKIDNENELTLNDVIIAYNYHSRGLLNKKTSTLAELLSAKKFVEKLNENVK